jgi:hypothetical protein
LSCRLRLHHLIVFFKHKFEVGNKAREFDS